MLEHGDAPAFWPWVQVLRGLRRSAEPAQLANWMGPRPAEIAQIAPGLRERLGAAELPAASLGQPEKARLWLFDSLIAFLINAAEAQPPFIVLDDLHARRPTTWMTGSGCVFAAERAILA